MNHKSAAKSHFRARVIESYGRTPSLKEIDKIRLAVKNKQCFLAKQVGQKITGIVKFRNIHIVAVYDKGLDGMVTAGVDI